MPKAKQRVRNACKEIKTHMEMYFTGKGTRTYVQQLWCEAEDDIDYIICAKVIKMQLPHIIANHESSTNKCGTYVQKQ